jgi:hypothetical protein
MIEPEIKSRVRTKGVKYELEIHPGEHLIVSVSGGMLSEGSITRLVEFRDYIVDHPKGPPGFLLLEVESIDESHGAPLPKIELTRLRMVEK